MHPTPPDTGRIAALLARLADAHDLDGPELGRAAWIWFFRRTLDWTAAGALAGAEKVGGGGRLTHAGWERYEGTLCARTAELDDAARLWALCHALPNRTIRELLDVLEDRAHVWLDRSGWHLIDGPLDPAAIEAAAELRDVDDATASPARSTRP